MIIWPSEFAVSSFTSYAQLRAHTSFNGMASRSLAQHQRQFDVPLFLAPAFANFWVPLPSRKSFSTSTRWCIAHNREKNKKRGVSAIRSTGPRLRLGVSVFPLPTPVDDADRRQKFKTNDRHGLWGFFGEDKRAMISPEDEAAFGRNDSLPTRTPV